MCSLVTLKQCVGKPGYNDDGDGDGDGGDVIMSIVVVMMVL